MTLSGFFEGTGMPDPGWWEALWPAPADVLLLAGVKPGMTVVDLCCGDGWFTCQLAKVAAEVIAIDIDAALLKTTKIRLAKTNATNCRLVESDAHDLAAHVHAPVDHVFFANAFHGVPDRLRLSAAVHSILKPTGLFAVVNWYPLPREETTVLGEPRGPTSALRLSPQSTREGVEPAGFRLRRCVDVSPYHYASVFERAR